MTSGTFLTFDCYGTLVDWETGIVEACRAAAAADGVTLDRETVLRVHAEVEPAVQAERFRSYRDVLIEVAHAIGRAAGWTLSRERAAFLPESLPQWPPFPETNGALRALARRGHPLGVLSNVDDALLAGTLDQLAVRFDLLVTAEQVRSYKPAIAHFERARRHVGARDWLHVAQSWFHDIAPAHALGIPAVWINRKGETPVGDAAPLAEVPTLAAFVEWLERGQRP
ncbi:MAG: HAD-IA family hydrolase [Gemmatimonadales bacterium]|jgi:2-haloacid dehalogenase/putative hydrolase of the HAD superfamily